MFKNIQLMGNVVYIIVFEIFCGQNINWFLICSIQMSLMQNYNK